MKDLILITGASSGIGMETTRLLAAKGFNLILTARSADKLQALRTDLIARHNVNIYVFATDLSKVDNAVKLYEEVTAANLKVNMLVNNAGFGLYGEFTETPLARELEMISLNISSLVALSKLFGADMKNLGKGRILNVASLLSFLPFPYYAVYSATKAFVLAFSESIAAELEGSGVIVSTLCPGPVDTSFTTPEMLSTNAYNTNKPVTAKSVAIAAVDLLLKGKGTVITGANNKFIVFLTRITPRGIMMRIKKKLASQVS